MLNAETMDEMAVTAARSRDRLGNGQIAQELDVFAAAGAFGMEDVHFKHDPTVGLQAIIAIHSTRLGPALGGTRCVAYPSTGAAIRDAFKLARGMSYKAAIHGLPLGGGKAVLIRPSGPLDREAYFEAYGMFVDLLGGRFVTAEDSGTSVADMDVIARCTSHVSGTSALGDPAPHTASGVRRGIEAAVAYRNGGASLADAHVAVQGVGSVGYHLVAELVARGARVTLADVDEEAARRCADEFSVRMVSPQEIYSVGADVFAPCALGGAINHQALRRLKAPIIAGSANNQLADDSLAELVHGRGVLYAPDYVINGGGLLSVAVDDRSRLEEKLDEIHDTLLELFMEAKRTNTPPIRIADQRAEAVLNGHAT